MGTDSISSRREFLRNALAMTVVSAAAPTMVLGRIVPELHKDSSGQMVFTYTIRLSTLNGGLDNVGDSIKLITQEQLKLNQDHRDYADLIKKGENIHRGWYPIAITRVAEQGRDAFKSVSTYCQHREGYQIDYKPNGTPGMVGRFVCPHKGSTFEVDGSRVTVQDTPEVDSDLRTFPTTFDDIDTITLGEVAVQLADVGDPDEIPAKAFLDQNYPNPFNPSTVIRYGLPNAMNVRMSIHTLLGEPVRLLFDGRQEAGIYYYDCSAEELPSGTYFYRLETPDGMLTRRMTVAK
jgi:hypothetical protein